LKQSLAKNTALVALLSSIVACGNPIGTPCSITGSGFTASHDCSEKCLYYNSIRCPDGQTLEPKICSGASGCKPGSCPDGQVCYSYDDPFEEQSYCIPASLCGSLSGDELENWETDASMRAAQKRSDWARKRPVIGAPTAEPKLLQPSHTE